MLKFEWFVQRSRCHRRWRKWKCCNQFAEYEKVEPLSSWLKNLTVIHPMNLWSRNTNDHQTPPGHQPGNTTKKLWCNRCRICHSRVLVGDVLVGPSDDTTTQIQWVSTILSTNKRVITVTNQQDPQYIYLQSELELVDNWWLSLKKKSSHTQPELLMKNPNA